MPSGQVDGGRRADAGEAADRKNPKIFKTHKQRTKDLNGDLSTFPKHCGMLKISWTQEPPGPGYEATSRGRRPNHLWFLWYFSRNTFLHTQAFSSRTTPLKTVPLYFGTWWKQVCLVGSLVWTEKFWICPGIKATSVKPWEEDFHFWVAFHTSRPASCLHLDDTVDMRHSGQLDQQQPGIRSSAWCPVNLPLVSALHPREVTLSSVTSWLPDQWDHTAIQHKFWDPSWRAGPLFSTPCVCQGRHC